MRASVTLAASGVHGGFSGTNGGKAGVRANVVGWSAASARNNLRFLRSIDASKIKDGLAFTLTIGELCTSSEWRTLTRKLVRYAVRHLGADLWHVVTEWQERGHPHLHGCVILRDDAPRDVLRRLVGYWLRITRHLGTSERGQMVKPMEGALGWFQYTAKHASRGFGHYQRMRDTMPPGWTETGRMWRASKGWPLLKVSLDMGRGPFFEMRRLVDRWSVAQVKSERLRAQRFGDLRQVERCNSRLRFLRRLRMAFGNGRGASETRGLNEWVPLDVATLMAQAAQHKQDGWKRERVSEHEERFSTANFSLRIVAPDRVRERAEAIDGGGG